MSELLATMRTLYAVGLLAVAFMSGALWVRVSRIEKWIEDHDRQTAEEQKLLNEVRIALGELGQKLDDLVARVDRLVLGSN